MIININTYLYRNNISTKNKKTHKIQDDLIIIQNGTGGKTYVIILG